MFSETLTKSRLRQAGAELISFKQTDSPGRNRLLIRCQYNAVKIGIIGSYKIEEQRFVVRWKNPIKILPATRDSFNESHKLLTYGCDERSDFIICDMDRLGVDLLDMPTNLFEAAKKFLDVSRYIPARTSMMVPGLTTGKRITHFGVVTQQ